VRAPPKRCLEDNNDAPWRHISARGSWHALTVRLAGTGGGVGRTTQRQDNSGQEEKHADGEEQTAENPRVGGVSAKTTPRSHFGGLDRGQWSVRNTGHGVKVFLGESSALRRQRRQCLWVS
jgi:hypothetical protein